MNLDNIELAVIGLGYVGLPLAVEFGTRRSVIGFDISERRVRDINEGRDATGEVSGDALRRANGLRCTNRLDDLRSCNCFIIAVPTPVDERKKPDLSPLIRASQTVAQVLKPGDVVIYESTVYPGCTEEDCVPVLEAHSGLKFNQDFFCGYSPERVNPGDKERPISSITKVTAGSNPAVADLVDALYRQIITAGTHKAESIRVAEAAKVIENAQRDLNIAFINEISLIFSRMGIDTEAVLRAASTKWNFVRLQPGLVGGHCIGVDPYYLIHKAHAVGYSPEVMLAGRRVNEMMGSHVARRLMDALLDRRLDLHAARILVLGLAFKENCADQRNTRVADIVNMLRAKGCAVDVFDPWVTSGNGAHDHGILPVEAPQLGAYDAIVVAVAHRQFKEWGLAGIRQFGKANALIYDLKYVLQRGEADLRL